MKALGQVLAAMMVCGILAAPASWGVMETPGSRHESIPGHQISSGFFGGIQKGQKLKLILSEQGGVLYFTTDRQLRAVRRGAAVELNQLPLKSPIAVYSEYGRAVRVDVLEVGR